MGTPAVRIRDVTKHFASAGGVVRAVDGVDVEIADGEFFCLLGPSGSGKTTLLRMIAGFEFPTGGTIELAGVDVTMRPPYERDVNTVFQDYALFPHMSVADNVGYGLRIAKVPANERRRRVDEALSMVRLPDHGGRKPAHLSGGQRQRVALARALINRPKVLLLDEPLGALDLKLREEMQVELKTLQRSVGITFVFVTHDQDEALTMSDRIAVFHQGRLAQVGTPTDVYERPATPFVAGFVGTSNILDGSVAEALFGVNGPVAIRPEKLRLSTGPPPTGLPPTGLPPTGTDHADGVVRHVEYLGAVTRTHVELDAGALLLVLRQNADTDPLTETEVGSRVTVSWLPDHVNRLTDTN